jgi:hypothetical protein
MTRFTLKPISKAAVRAALERAQLYRLLNQPLQAESICLDALAADPDNAEAHVALFLALTDQFPRELQPAFERARKLLPGLPDAYSRLYYEGLLCERRGKAHLRSGPDGQRWRSSGWMAMAFTSAPSRLPAGRRDAVLRWNRPPC